MDKMNADERARDMVKWLNTMNPPEYATHAAQFIEDELRIAEAQARKEAYEKTALEIRRVNVHGRNPYDNGTRNGLKVSVEIIEELMEDEDE